MSSPRPRRAHAARGFTLVELMVVVVILGVLAFVSAPMFGQNRRERDGRNFYQTTAWNLERLRTQAVAERLVTRAMFFADRVEYWVAAPGAAAGAEWNAPNAPFAVQLARPGIFIRNVEVPPGTLITPTGTAAAEVRFTTIGGAFSPTATLLDNIVVRIENTTVPAGHPYRQARINITAITGSVQQEDRW